ncbi:MAG TPA: STAS domain-containing protein [Candidatus Ozemobacteraceae bacterium]|nr:STAS domain-containing protein [Candidatus Ozemobacteraceae bacterium]
MSNFTITTANINGVFIIRPCGYVDEHGGAAIFATVQKALPEGHQKFILNLAASPVINSQGIAQIIELAEIIVDEKNGELAFTGLSELAGGVFKMVGLLQMGDAYPSEQQAIEALGG